MQRFAVLVALALALAGLPGLTGPSAVAATPTAGQSLYVPLDPVRLLDTRTGLGGRSGRLGAGETFDLPVADGVRVPASATSVLLNITATGAGSATDVRVYPVPVDGAVPLVSSLNVVPGLTVANLVTVKVGPEGRVRLRNQSGDVHLVVDLSGYTTTSPGSGSAYVPTTPVRLLDTREQRAPLAAGEARPLDVRLDADGAASGVPAGASAVVLNVTAVAPTSTTDLRVYPTRSGGGVPLVSNLNTSAGRTVPNLVVVAVGDLSSVTLRNQAGSVHLLADLAGWYVPGDAGAAFHPVDPERLFDTRVAGGTRLGAGQVLDLRIAGVGRVPAPASAVALNVTAVAPSSTSDIRVYPSAPGGPPEVSNLNVVRGQTVPNAVVVRVGQDGAVRLYNSGGTVDLVVDLAGWYAPTGDGWDVSWPQCTARGASTSRLPTGGGAFAVVGLTRSVPFTDNECFAAQWQWASSLPGEPMVYLNLNAPGVRDRSAEGNRVWEEVCGTGTATSACGLRYGERIAQYALPRLPTAPGGGRPMVWMDVEGPYANGPFWQQEATADPLAQPNPNAVAVNRAVIQGVVDVLRAAGYRIGTYSDRASVGAASNDWRSIVGEWRLLQMQNWVFRSPDAEPRTICGPEHSFSGGPVVMAQVQPATNPGVGYDVNGLC